VKSFIYLYFSRCPKVPVLLLGAVVLPLAALAQTPKPSLPDPVKFVNKYDIVWNVARWAVTEGTGLSLELEDRKGGRLVSKPYEFITGSLTESETEKVAVISKTLTGNWVRARYAAEVLLEVVTPTETLVTVRTKVEALNRDMDGSEKWTPLDSLGVFEKRILSKISMKLLGTEMEFDSKKGFWDRRPQPVDPRGPKTSLPRPPE
jgi:hypothetical protein